jgi:carbonic anhydrase/acetyltransferase-like protein (isoleucine patch superfamily)
MPIYSLDGLTPRFPEAPEFWVASTAVLVGQVRLKRDASIWFGAVLRAEDDVIEIGERSNVQDNCVLHVEEGFPLTIGDDCTIGHKAMLHGCTIGSNTLIGMCATVLDGARIGNNCLVGANALITGNTVIPDNSLVMGSPGKVVRQIDEAGVRFLTQAAERYTARWRRYARGLAAQESTGTSARAFGAREVQ